MDLHHPLIRSLALPLLVAFASAGALHGALGAVQGRRWAATGVALAIVGAAVWLLDWHLWPRMLTDELPWIYAAAALLGVGLEAMRASRQTSWLAGAVLWALVLAGLSDQPLIEQVLAWLAGAVVIGAVLSPPPDSADAPASLAVAALGLAAVAFISGSALLFELGLAIAAAVAGCLPWLWPQARVAFGACGAVAAVIAWLALAQTVALLSPVRPLALLLLAGAFLAGPIIRVIATLRRPRASRPWARTLIVVALAAAWVAGAVALALLGGAPAPTGGADDPYYTPRW